MDRKTNLDSCEANYQRKPNQPRLKTRRTKLNTLRGMHLTAWKGMEVPALNGRRIWTVREHPSLMLARHDDGWAVFASHGSKDQSSRQVILLGLDKQRFATRRQLLDILQLALS